MVFNNDLDSSNLKDCCYDTHTKELRITFHNGRTYSYEDVPFDVWNGLVTTMSAGQYFNAVIKNVYQTTEV